jgi:hypothetical protein
MFSGAASELMISANQQDKFSAGDDNTLMANLPRSMHLRV